MVDGQALLAIKEKLGAIQGLQVHLTDFNIFGLLGTAHLELAHTRILAFLFDLQGQHGFGAAFSDRFLQAVAEANDPNLVWRHFGDRESWAFDPAVVQREQQSVDLRVIDPVLRIVLLIENKVHSSEHDDQLRRYRLAMSEQLPASEWRIVPIYLTLTGERPTDPTYLVANYRMVARVVEDLLADEVLVCLDSVRMTLEHYVSMTRRELVGDWDLAAKAKQLYDLAPQAFDFIVEQKHYPRAEMQDLFGRFVSDTPDLVKEPEVDINQRFGVAYVRFSHSAFDHLEAIDRLTRERLWTNSRRMLLFQFDITEKNVTVGLFVGPGPEAERRRLIAIAERSGPPFDMSLWQGNVGKRRWRAIYGYEFANATDFEDLDFGVLSQRLHERWHHFLATELERVIQPFAHAGQSATLSESQ